MTKVTVCAPVNPSEDPEKVLAAMLNIFPTGTFVREGDSISGDADLENF